MRFCAGGVMVALILGMAGAVVAQSPLQSSSSTLKEGQPVPEKCVLEAKALEPLLTQSTPRSGWVNIVACDDLAWQYAMDRPGHIIRSQGDSLLDFTRHAKVFRASEFPLRRSKTVESRAVARVKASTAPVAKAPSVVPAM